MSSTLPPDVVKSTGPFILGYLLNLGLFGVCSVQVYYYYIAFPNDRLYCKFLVYGIYVLETAQTSIIIRDAFARFGVSFGDFEALDNVKLPVLSIPVITGVVGCVVQVYYAYRISTLSRTKIPGYVIVIVSIAGCVAALMIGVKCFQVGRLSKIGGKYLFAIAGVWWGCCAFCDVTIAIAMTYLLSRYDTGLRSTQLTITKLTRLTIETGTVTALVAVINLLLCFGYPNDPYYIVPVSIIAELYYSTLMVLLNSRMRILGGRGEPSATVDFLAQLPAPIFRLQPSLHMQDSTATTGQVHPTESVIHVTTEVYVKNDSVGQVLASHL